MTVLIPGIAQLLLFVGVMNLGVPMAAAIDVGTFPNEPTPMLQFSLGQSGCPRALPRAVRLKVQEWSTVTLPMLYFLPLPRTRLTVALTLALGSVAWVMCPAAPPRQPA